MISPSVRACVCASVRPIWGFPGFFSTPFHTATWNFAWGFSELCYTSSSRFVIVTTTVPELRALGFFTLGHMHVPVFRGFFYTVSYRNLKLCMRVSSVTLHIEFAFRHRDHYGSGVMCPWIFYSRTYVCNSFFYTISYRNLKLCMWLFRVTLHIKFALRCRDHYSSGVKCPWIFYS